MINWMINFQTTAHFQKKAYQFLSSLICSSSRVHHFHGRCIRGELSLLINAESAPVKYFLPAKTIDGNNEKIVNRWNIESNVMLFYRFFSGPQTYCQ